MGSYRRFAVVLTAIAALLPGAGLTAGEGVPQNEPGKGMVYDGLVWEPDGTCAGAYRVEGSEECTHGPDEAPDGYDVSDTYEYPPGRAEVWMAPPVRCDGDGAGGPRVQLIYARASDRPDRFSSVWPYIQLWGTQIDGMVADSAAKTGGVRNLRFVHDANCRIVVANAVMDPIGDDNIANTLSELKRLGYLRTDRKYVAFVDAQVYCGIGMEQSDDQPGPANKSNGRGYARVDTGCWSGFTAAHELMHTLGAVQRPNGVSAPHGTGRGHCFDEYDRMCYVDAANKTLQYLCTAPNEKLFDCNDDDYFSTRPQAGSYLATHWNTANNVYLIGHGEAGAFRADADYDGDGRTDTAVWRPSTAEWFVTNSSNGSTWSRRWGVLDDVPVPADYDGDGKADLAVWRPSTGVWWVINSSTNTWWADQWGYNGDLPVPADYDGDGKADEAVWRPTTGEWWVVRSSNLSTTLRQWGLPGDHPVPGDFNGDGVTEFAVWRPSSGIWHVLFVYGVWSFSINRQWGLREDVPVVADYDADGWDDFAVWRPSSGEWFVVDSARGSWSSTWNRRWGVTTDHPLPGDYDGDGRADTAIWRPASGVWWVVNSTSGAGWTRQWGTNGDVPVP